MSATYEPFTPANGSSRRRASWDEEPAWNGSSDQQWSQQGSRSQDSERWPQQDPWAQQDQWSQPAQQDQWSQPAQQDQWSQPAQQDQWAQPAQQQWQQDQRWAAAPAPQQQQWAAASSPRTEARSSRPGRGRLVIIGLVGALLLVSGWQAFRVESMIKTSTDLADAVSSEQGRTQDLEKKLTTVFDPEGISSAVIPSVFRVRAGDFTGTAFAVGQTDDGKTNLFTNYHVIEETFKDGDRQVSLERGNTRIEARIVKVDADRDLALLRADREIKGLAPAAGDVKAGQQVVVVGAPLGLDDSVTTGVISAYRPDDSDGPTIQFDAPINPGNSGGPVVNSSRQVVGIATAKARDAEGIGLAIPIQTACDTLDVCGNN
ncbi:trypsin-like peptidase domain-containing protein [Actinoplanes sp. GCM10030250]|uniref:trypsin-like peptidase domain-containing protein n=1 Tax=Actinoplanes sp. GCM10030250 TaxID=3273376 RepID=UPI003614B58A